jgi:hypothetical protein
MSADEPVSVVIAPDAPRNCVVAVVPKVVPVRVVILALVTFKLVIVPEAKVPSVVPVNVVMFALVAISVVMVAEVEVKLVIVAEPEVSVVMFALAPRN